MESLIRKQIRDIDNTAIEVYKIPRIILMEHAGLGVAKDAVKLLDSKIGSCVFVFCGAGYNGGDGLVAARHMFNWGYKVVVVLVGKEEKCKEETLINLNILKKLKIEIVKFQKASVSEIEEKLVSADLIIDSIFGIGITGTVRTPESNLIKCLNDSAIPILSVDVPSGLNSDTGEICGVSIQAIETVTFVAPKRGFFLKNGPECAGNIEVCDISIPRTIIERKTKGGYDDTSRA